MRTEEFKDTLKKLRYPLDKLFHKKLRNVNKSNRIQETKKALIHETAIKAWIRFQRADSNAYKLETLIFLAAEDVWVGFIKPRKKERHEFYDPELMADFCDSFDMAAQLEAIDYLSSLQSQHDLVVWKMLTLRASGHTYDQISSIMQISKTTVRETIIKSQTKMRNDMFPKPPGSTKNL